jgi:hypothetical protein
MSWSRRIVNETSKRFARVKHPPLRHPGKELDHDDGG